MKKAASPKDAVRPVIARYWKTNRAAIPVLAATIAMSLFSGVMTGVLSRSIQAIVDGFSQDGILRWSQAWILILAALILFPALYLQQYLGQKFNNQCDLHMRARTFRSILHMDMQRLEGQKTGDILSRANSDLEQMNGALRNFFSVRFPQQILGVVCLGVSLWINWELALASLLMVPIFAVIQIRISVPIAKLTKQRQALMGETLSVANNLMGGYEVAKAYDMGDALKAKYNEGMDEATRRGLAVNRATVLMSPLSSVMFFLPQIIICGFGVWLAHLGRLTPGALLSVLTLSAMIRTPLQDFSMVIGQIRTAVGCSQRLFALWDAEQEPPGGEQDTPADGLIVVQDVQFAYPGEPPVLNGLSFRIQAGEHIALVGASGCGKSTVFKLLMGFYRTSSGQIEFLGHTQQEWNLEAMRRQIAYVSQDAYLFPGTIWDNVAMGREGASEAEIRQCIEAALLSDVDVQRELGEGGLRLSGGQRQRVSIARAMLKNAPVLLLDEPTSALDTQSEALVTQALHRLMEGRTTILIAHRLSALQHIDRVICLQDGVVAETGAHEDLMRSRGVYYQLYRSQVERRETA